MPFRVDWFFRAARPTGRRALPERANDPPGGSRSLDGALARTRCGSPLAGGAVLAPYVERSRRKRMRVLNSISSKGGSMQRTRGPIIVMLSMLAALAVGVIRAGAATSDDIVQMVQNAKTPADHEAIATYYDGLAADARKQAAAHKQMEKSYGSGSSTGKGTWVKMPQHCANIAKD